MKNIYENHFKIEVLQYLGKGNKIAKASHKFNVHPSTIYAWTQIGIEGFLSRGQVHTSPEPEPVAAASGLARRMQQLEQENAVLRQAAKLYFMYS
ncbi:IS630 transposase-related protein [uncultured Deefgea sp.]|uniref:IS630 transposase-related protein n=1 Tax=uncultured Deefgea sp. TaxID=1304914 RepID=UPI002597EC27|nr:helix-turn-helix domain-containing protein [uncultured Deefgea sp.]